MTLLDATHVDDVAISAYERAQIRAYKHLVNHPGFLAKRLPPGGVMQFFYRPSYRLPNKILLGPRGLIHLHSGQLFSFSNWPSSSNHPRLGVFAHRFHCSFFESRYGANDGYAMLSVDQKSFEWICHTTLVLDSRAMKNEKGPGRLTLREIADDMSGNNLAYRREKLPYPEYSPLVLGLTEQINKQNVLLLTE